MRAASFYARYSRLIAALGLLLLPPVAVWALQGLSTNHNDVADWLPDDYVETAEYRWFRRHFGNDAFVLVTWEGCTLDDERLDQLAERLREIGDEQDLRFGRIITGRSVLQELTGPPARLTPEEAAARLRGSLVGPGGRQTCAIVSLPEDQETPVEIEALLGFVRQAAADCGIPSEDLRLGGQPAINAAVDEVSERANAQSVLASFFIVLLIAWRTVRDPRLIVLVLATGIYSALASLAALWLLGGRMDAILITMIPMVYVTATSGAIHLCNYYVESAREEGESGAAGRAVAHAWVPLGLATATTAAGLLSVCYNDLILIQRFGAYSALGVGLSWLLLMLWLPAMLTVWPARGNRPAASAEPSVGGGGGLSPGWTRLGEFVMRHSGKCLAGCLLLLVLCAPGMSRLNVSIDLMKEFRSDQEIIQTYEWIEQKLGPSMPVEVVLRFDEECPLTPLDRLRLVSGVEQRVRAIEGVGGAMSVATFAPDFDGEGREWLRQGMFNRRLRSDRSRLLDSGYLADAEGEELWRITARVATLQEVDYSVFSGQLREAVEAELDAASDEDLSGVTAVYTGVAPVLFKARLSLVDGVVWGLVTDLALIVLTVTLALRHWSHGLLMLLTGVFPAFVVLGVAGWLGLRISIGAMIAPCVALGVTVDDVIHFLLWFREGAQRGLDRRQAVLLAWHACVRPMYQSWTLLGLGMAALAVSPFLPILQFGAVMAAMLTMGLAGNLFLLPSLLTSPLGAIIARRATRPVPEFASPEAL